MDLSFIILSWNSERYIESCVESIRTSLAGSSLEYEVLILDNGSQDRTASILAELATRPATRLVPVFKTYNLGTTSSRNILLSAAKGRYLCVMDSDVELAPGVLDALIPVLNADRSVGLVGPKIFYPSGKWQKSFDRFPTVADKVRRFFHLRAIEQEESRRFSAAVEAFPVHYLISAFWLMRRDTLERVGLLDEAIFYAPEDTDFCLRVWKASLRILYVPSVSVVHHTQEISRGFKINRAKLSHLKGLCYYFLKHRYFLRRPAFPHVDALSEKRS